MFFCVVYTCTHVHMYTGKRLKQALLKFKIKIGGNHSFFRENLKKASICKKMPYIVFVNYCCSCRSINSEKNRVAPIFFLDSNSPCYDLLFMHSHKLPKFILSKTCANFHCILNTHVQYCPLIRTLIYDWRNVHCPSCLWSKYQVCISLNQQGNMRVNGP